MFTRRSLAPLLLLILCASRLFSQSAEEYLRRGDSLRGAGDARGAIASYDRAILLDGSSEMAYRGRGMAWLGLRNYEQGEKDYHSALGLNPKCASCYAGLAQVAAEQRHDFDKAIELINTGILIDPKDGGMYLMRGKIKRAQGRASEALVDFNKAVEAEPENAVMYMERGTYNIGMGFFPVAVSDFSKVIGLVRRAPDAYYSRAHSLTQLGRFDEALADLDSAIAQGGRRTSYYSERAAALLDLGRYSQALAGCDTAIALDPKNYQAYYSRGMVRYKLDDLDGACADMNAGLDIIVEANPNDPATIVFRQALLGLCDSAAAPYYYQRGIAEYNKRNFTAALGFYNAGLKKFPDNPVFNYLRGNAYMELRRFPDAINDYQGVLNKKDDYLRKLKEIKASKSPGVDESIRMVASAIPSIYESIARARTETGDYPGALESVNDAIALSTGASVRGMDILYIDRGDLNLLTGADQDAVEDYGRAILVNPASATPYINRAIAYINLSGGTRVNFAFLRAGSPNGARHEGIFPIASGKKEGREFLERALASCSKAIEIDSTSGRAYLIRGYIKGLMAADGACDDLKEAKSLGDVNADELIGAYCK